MGVAEHLRGVRRHHPAVSGTHREMNGEKLRGRRLGALAVGAWTLLIWGHSLLPADRSSAESGRVLELLEPILQLLGLAPELWSTVVRKCAHMAEFAILGGLWGGMPLPQPARPRDRWTAVMLACMTTALLDETIQLFISGRSGRISDVWIDLSGAVLGMAVAAVRRGR